MLFLCSGVIHFFVVRFHPRTTHSFFFIPDLLIALLFQSTRAIHFNPSTVLVLLRHKFQSLLGLSHPLAQHGHRGSVRANWMVMARLTVAIELVT